MIMHSMNSQGYINVGLFVLLIAIGALVLSRPVADETPDVAVASTNFTDSALGLTLNYPSTFTVSAGEASDYQTGSYLLDATRSDSNPLPVRTSFQLHNAPYEGTNLSGAWVNLSSLRPNDIRLAPCQQATHGGQIISLNSTKDINGTTWYYDTVGDAAAGTSFATTIYHAEHNGMCYELASTIAAGNIGNWEPGAIAQYDEAAVKQQVEDLIMTVKFTN